MYIYKRNFTHGLPLLFRSASLNPAKTPCSLVAGCFTQYLLSTAAATGAGANARWAGWPWTRPECTTHGGVSCSGASQVVRIQSKLRLKIPSAATILSRDPTYCAVLRLRVRVSVWWTETEENLEILLKTAQWHHAQDKDKIKALDLNANFI